MIDYYTGREQVYDILLRLWQNMDISEDSLVYSWITYAINFNGNNPFVIQALKQSRSWVETEEFWANIGNLSSFSIFYFLSHQLGSNYFEALVPKYISSLRDLIEKGISKFSKLNDPHFMYSIALGSKGILPDDLKVDLSKQCVSNAQSGGSIVRTLLFTAGSIELDAPTSSIMIKAKDLEPYDLLTALWFSERYSSHLVNDQIRLDIWNIYDQMKEGYSLDPLDREHSLPYPISPVDLVLLYEAVSHQAAGIDPLILFLNIPFHPRVKQVSEKSFINRDYVNSVFEATKAFIEAVKIKAGYPKDSSGKELDGFKLMEFTFQVRKPILKFNPLTKPSEIDEQSGLQHLSEGVVSAFRNPKGHIPAIGITISPYEALEQLSTISYLMRRLDSSTIV
jgi:uncharacterized protein (TIGR02391 family)